MDLSNFTHNQEFIQSFIFRYNVWGIIFDVLIVSFVGFIYIKGKSILPSGSFQQTTRTRNIKNIYFYCNVKSKQPKNNNLSEVKDKYLNINKMTEALNKNCVSLNENDEQIINKNLFFNVFCYNEYVKDVYKTNKLIHYKNILSENGFIIVDNGEQPNIYPLAKMILKIWKKLKKNTIIYYLNNF